MNFFVFFILLSLLISIVYFFSLKKSWLTKIQNHFYILFQSIGYIVFGISLFKGAFKEEDAVSYGNLFLAYTYVTASAIIIVISIEKSKPNNAYEMKTFDALYYSIIVAMTMLFPPVFLAFYK